MEKTIKTYQSLNKLAATGRTVIFGGAEDRLIPLGKLKDTFDLQDTYSALAVVRLFVAALWV